MAREQKPPMHPRGTARRVDTTYRGARQSHIQVQGAYDACINFRF